MTQEQQFLAIYDEFMPRIFRHVAARVGNRQTAEDIVSETFFRAWGYVRQGKPVDNMKSLCYTIANNLTTDHYRKKYRGDVSLDAVPEITSDAHSVSKIQAVSETKLLQNKLASLPGEYGAILAYRYIDDMDIREIAKTVNKSSAHIYVIIHRALKMLKKEFNEK